MNKEIRNLMQKHNLPESIMTLYGLEVERIAEEYSQSKNKDLQHFKDSSKGLYCIDKNPVEVSKDWFVEHSFEL